MRDGKQFLNQSMGFENMGTQFAKFHAPRLAIGYTNAGELLIVEVLEHLLFKYLKLKCSSKVDGLESIDAGVSLWELADIAIHFGAVSAINLDGTYLNMTHEPVT